MAQLDQISAEVAHAIDLQKTANGIASASNKQLDDISDSIVKVLLKYDAIDSIKTRNAIVKAVRKILADGLEGVTDDIESAISKVIKQEIKFQYALLRNITNVKSKQSTQKDTLSLIEKMPLVLDGKAITWQERIGDYPERTLRNVLQVIQAGWANGSTTADIARQIAGTQSISGVIPQAKSAANALAKDLLTHQSSMAKRQLAIDNDDIVIGEKTIVTLDSRTSKICRGYGSQNGGGKVWLYSKYGRNFPRPPFHYRCRSVNILIVADEYALDMGKQTRPAVIDGVAKQVPAETGWYQLAKQYPAMAEQSLGPTRAKILDNMSAEEFVKVAYNRLGDELTIDQMVANSKKVAALLK